MHLCAISLIFAVDTMLAVVAAFTAPSFVPPAVPSRSAVRCDAPLMREESTSRCATPCTKEWRRTAGGNLRKLRAREPK